MTYLRDDRASLGRRTHGEMDRFLQEVTDEAHMRMLMHREVRLAEPHVISLRRERSALAPEYNNCRE